MDRFLKEDLEKALEAINSMIRRSEKVQPKFEEGTSQASLTRNRLKALYLSSSLIARELGQHHPLDSYNKDELKKAAAPITSTIGKCEKALDKLKEGSPQKAMTRNMINALKIALALITKEINA